MTNLERAIARYHALNERQRGGKVWNEKRGTFEVPAPAMVWDANDLLVPES